MAGIPPSVLSGARMAKEATIKLALVLGSICLTLTATELGFRAYHFFKYEIHGNCVQDIRVDDKLGWRAARNYRFKGTTIDKCGQQYEIDVRTDKEGFRMFGDVASKKERIFFLGDSYTHAIDVSNEKTFYGILSQLLPIEVFAYGAGGYGTLQEYIILDEYLDIIKPDKIVLQYCSNDFINNSFELESNSNINNMGLNKPYWAPTPNGNGNIEYKLPRNMRVLRALSSRYSRFLYMIIHRMDISRENLETSVESSISKQGDSHPGLNRSAKTTEALLRMLRARVPSKIKIYAFDADPYQPYYQRFKTISERNGIEFIGQVPHLIWKAEEDGRCVRALDGIHWNELAHKIAANELFEVIRRRN